MTGVGGLQQDVARFSQQARRVLRRGCERDHEIALRRRLGGG
jgi:hypothetical protein